MIISLQKPLISHKEGVLILFRCIYLNWVLKMHLIIKSKLWALIFDLTIAIIWYNLLVLFSPNDITENSQQHIKFQGWEFVFFYSGFGGKVKVCHWKHLIALNHRLFDFLKYTVVFIIINKAQIPYYSFYTEHCRFNCKSNHEENILKLVTVCLFYRKREY